MRRIGLHLGLLALLLVYTSALPRFAHFVAVHATPIVADAQAPGLPAPTPLQDHEQRCDAWDFLAGMAAEPPAPLEFASLDRPVSLIAVAPDAHIHVEGGASPRVTRGPPA